MVRVVLPYHLRNLAQVSSEVQLDVPAPVTAGAILDALEARYPMLCGAIRDHGTLKRRAFLRFFVCQEDVSHDPPDTPLPEEVASGKEPFYIIGAIAGGCGTCATPDAESLPRPKPRRRIPKGPRAPGPAPLQRCPTACSRRMWCFAT